MSRYHATFRTKIMRKGFNNIPREDIVTPVFDKVSCTIPDQTLSLREMMLQFAYIGNDRLEDIINRGFDGDEDNDDILGVDAGALDYAEIHDRVLHLQEKQAFSRNLHQPATPEDVTTVQEPTDEPAEDSPEAV